jgi:hypothetical protein
MERRRFARGIGPLRPAPRRLTLAVVHHGAKFCSGVIGAVLLDEGRGDREDAHDCDDDSGPDVTKKIGNR